MVDVGAQRQDALDGRVVHPPGLGLGQVVGQVRADHHQGVRAPQEGEDRLGGPVGGDPAHGQGHHVRPGQDGGQEGELDLQGVLGGVDVGAGDHQPGGGQRLDLRGDLHRHGAQRGVHGPAAGQGQGAHAHPVGGPQHDDPADPPAQGPGPRPGQGGGGAGVDVAGVGDDERRGGGGAVAGRGARRLQHGLDVGPQAGGLGGIEQARHRRRTHLLGLWWLTHEDRAPWIARRLQATRTARPAGPITRGGAAPAGAEGGPGRPGGGGTRARAGPGVRGVTRAGP